MCHLKRIIIDNRIQSHNDVLGDFKLCLWRIINMGNPYDNKFVKKSRMLHVTKVWFKFNVIEHVYEVAEGNNS